MKGRYYHCSLDSGVFLLCLREIKKRMRMATTIMRDPGLMGLSVVGDVCELEKVPSELRLLVKVLVMERRMLRE
jgi:hypothetical protein